MYGKRNTRGIICLLFLGLIISSIYGEIKVLDQFITLNYFNTPLREVLQSISDQADIKFVYCDEQVDPHQVTCKIKQGGLRSTLDTVFAGTEIAYRFITDETVVLYLPPEKKGKKTEPLDPDDSLFIENKMRPPVLKCPIEPDYPTLAKNQGLEGSVSINMLVSGEGQVEDVIVTNSSGHGILDQAAKEFARQLTFEPAMQGDNPVNIWISRNFNYTLDDSGLIPVHYLQRIRGFRKQLESADPAARRSIEYSLLKTHEEYCRIFHQAGDLSNNEIVKLIIDKDVFTNWQIWWDTAPVYFLVYHDFLRKYPDSEYSLRALEKLQYFAALVINTLNYQSSIDPKDSDRINRFIDYVRTFLTNDYHINVIKS